MLFKNLPEGVMVFDQDDTLIQFNNAASHLLQIQKSSIGVGRHAFYDQLKSSANYYEIKGDALETLMNPYSGSSPVWYRISETPIHDKKGSQRGTLLYIRDITTVKVEKETSRKREGLLKILTEISQQLLHQQKLAKVLNTHWFELGNLLGVDHLTLYRFIDDNNPTETTTFQSYSNKRAKGLIDIDDNIKRQIKAFKEIMFYSQVDRQEQNSLYKYANIHNISYQLIIPINLENACWGFVNIVSFAPDFNLSIEERSIIKSLSDTIGSAIQRHLLEEDLKISVQKSVEALNTKSDFLSNMSHEIRTPLNGIIGFTDLLEKSNMDEQQKDYLATIRGSSHTLLSLINDILDFSKIEAGKIDITPEKVKIRTVVKEVVDMVSIKYASDNVNILVDIHPNTPDYVFVDKLRLQQVLSNLVSNALKFTSKGFVKVSVTPVSMGGGRGSFKFSILDTGKGIRKENIAKILRPFEQEDYSITKEYGGTGLGLSITTKLLSLMKSELHVESTVGEGSHFFFSIELSYEDINRKKKDDKKLDFNFPLSTQQLLNQTVLIVDDDIMSQKLLTYQLESISSDLNLLLASSGEEALHFFRKYNPGLIFVDEELPGSMNGSSLIKVIRAMSQINDEEPIIILISSFVNDNPSPIATTSGANAFLSKPIEAKKFNELLCS